MKVKRSNVLRYGYDVDIQTKNVKYYDIQKLINDLTEPSVWKTHIDNSNQELKIREIRAATIRAKT